MPAVSRLLILSASYGEGHQQAAVAVQGAMSAISPETDIQIIDYIRAVHPMLDSVAKYCYLTSVRYAPALYGLFYRGTMQIPPTSLIQRQLNSIGLHALERQIRTYQPDVILSTFPTPAGVASFLKEQGRIQVPLATAITDHAVHSQWIHPHTDLYFVGSQRVKNGLVRRGIPANRVKVTGIPIRPAFALSYDREALAQKYGLDSSIPTVLIMGGAYGVLGDIYAICDELFHSKYPLQVLVVTGKNERMKVQLDELARDASTSVHVFGFVEAIHELMHLSDVMLTKAGGLTISEALAVQLPMVLYRPIPGQEVQNAAFLCKSGAALLARNREEVVHHLYDLLIHNPGRRLLMRQRTARIRKLHAAAEIVDGLVTLARRPSAAGYRAASEQGS
ncbi:glycosyltransferase [Alicyclobacillus cycloheptanicus]|uniref:Processive 1,2-diacylglycerol beta-glucosyltransferase n=1 Tax=Alicyclobacillus cycloheptanicus TaxID=1457 RepID=A0ABT9XGK0_9BACL|nr:glycosyltransferase [Alicyclobacillus cycloheptanicus]MDQ0189430.1 processive 1,2-diacylglycerol beta-glucosyltransferase [Alicyclobacillus cycloheptanicus]WDM02300.1 glycosyltransferase [Alicyclobacillus cycloheptanicus]